MQGPSAPAPAGAPSAAPSGVLGSGIFGPAPGALAQPLQQLLAQRPVLTALQQQVAAIVQGATSERAAPLGCLCRAWGQALPVAAAGGAQHALRLETAACPGAASLH